MMSTFLVPLALVGFLVHLTVTNHQYLDGGLLLYSRWPILSVESRAWTSVDRVHFPEALAAKGFLWARILKRGRVVNVINLHSCSACEPVCAI